MAERIVVAFVTQLESARGAVGDAYLESAKKLRARAEVLGGMLSAWGAESVAFDFAVDDLEEAIALAVGTLQAEAPEIAAPLAVVWSVGLSQGELTRIDEDGALGALAWGPPLLTATSLAGAGRPGELLADPEMPSITSGELLTSGARTGKDGRQRVKGMLLDPR